MTHLIIGPVYPPGKRGGSKMSEMSWKYHHHGNLAPALLWSKACVACVPNRVVGACLIQMRLSHQAFTKTRVVAGELLIVAQHVLSSAEKI